MITIFQDTDTKKLAAEVNAFEKNHKVFATQHSTVFAGGEGGVIVTTIIVFSRDE
jgi:hypothetical protein